MNDIPHIIVLINSSSEYGRGLLKGIARYSRLHGPWAFFSEQEDPEKIIPMLKDWNIKGIITWLPGKVKAKTILPPNVPTIIVTENTEVKGYPNIVGNWQNEGRLAAEYFHNRGFTNLAFCGFANSEWSNRRQKGFCDYTEEKKLQFHLCSDPWTNIHRYWKKEQRKLADWLVSLPKPVGVMACNDTRGKHVLEACKIADICVPEQIAVLGVDNDETVCELTDPPLSSMAVNTERAGYEAAQLLDEMMKSKTCYGHDITVKPLQVAERQSTDILAIADEIVAKSLRFIKLNAKTMIQVENVAENVNMSRRGLERRFNKYLKHSIHEEIRKAKTQEIRKLLLETNLSVSQISSSMSFSEIAHMSRFFTRETGLSPVAYRKKHLGNLQNFA